MATTDTQLQQLVINVGTEAQIANAIAGGTITNDMLSIATDGADISYDWIGTLAEYEAQQVATNHPDWLCFITDDVTISNENVYENVYTKAETNELFMAKNDLIAYQPNLLDFKWADHLLNDIQWLRADTFSWQDGSVYEAVYNHLYTEFMAAITAQGNVPYTETIGGITISYYLAEDGHKICPASEESDLSSLFETVGVAWYYLLDTTNQRFKLPRTKFGFQGRHTVQTAVGSYIAPGLPNITGTFYGQNAALASGSGAFVTGSNPYGGTVSASNANNQMFFDASRSSSVYGNSTTVQPPATEMYLYFYVGTFTQEAIVNTAGINSELFNNKIDVGSSFGLPSGQYTDLDLPASNNPIISPGNGYIVLKRTATAAGQHVTLENVTAGELRSVSLAYASGNIISVFVPVKKGDQVQVIYSAATAGVFRLIHVINDNG